MITQNKRLTFILVGVLLLLLVPFIAMQFTHEVNWSTQDFLVAGLLLTGTGLLCEFAVRKLKTRRQRIIACAIIVLLLLVVWLELAVGIFGTSFAGK